MQLFGHSRMLAGASREGWGTDKCLLTCLLGWDEEQKNACRLTAEASLKPHKTVQSNPKGRNMEERDRQVGRGNPLLYWGLDWGGTCLMTCNTWLTTARISFISWCGHVTSCFMTTLAYNGNSTFNCGYKSGIICVGEQEEAHSPADKKQSGVQCGCSSCLKQSFLSSCTMLYGQLQPSLSLANTTCLAQLH